MHTPGYDGLQFDGCAGATGASGWGARVGGGGGGGAGRGVAVGGGGNVGATATVGSAANGMGATVGVATTMIVFSVVQAANAHTTIASSDTARAIIGESRLR